MHPAIRNASITVFKKHLLKEMRRDLNSVYNICKPIGLKLLTRLRLGFSHLNEHRFNHSFGRTLLTLCVLVVWRQNQLFIFTCTPVAIILSDLYFLMSNDLTKSF